MSLPFSMDEFEEVNAVKAFWPSDQKDPHCAAQSLAGLDTLRPRFIRARMIWHELRALCLDALGRRDAAYAEAVAADALYDAVDWAECWSMPWRLLAEIDWARGEHENAMRWIDRAEEVCARIPERSGRPQRMGRDYWASLRQGFKELEEMERCKQSVLQALRQHSDWVIQSEFAQKVAASVAGNVRHALYSLAQEGAIERVKHGRTYRIRAR